MISLLLARLNRESGYITWVGVALLIILVIVIFALLGDGE